MLFLGCESLPRVWEGKIQFSCMIWTYEYLKVWAKQKHFISMDSFIGKTAQGKLQSPADFSKDVPCLPPPQQPPPPPHTHIDTHKQPFSSDVSEQ